MKDSRSPALKPLLHSRLPYRIAAVCLTLLMILTGPFPGPSVLKAATPDTSGTPVTPATPVASVSLPASASTLDAKLAASVMLYVGSNLARINNELVPIDPGKNGTAPFVVSGTTLVPVRFLAESTGGVVQYDGVTGTATLKSGTKTIKIRNGSKSMTVDGVTVALDVAPLRQDGRMYAPLRPVSEALGKHLFYDRGLIVVSEAPVFLDKTRDATAITEQIGSLGMVHVARTSAELMKELAAWQNRTGAIYRDGGPLLGIAVVNAAAATSDSAKSSGSAEMAAAAPAAPVPQASAASGTAGDSSADAHSTTNVQVEGVDEGDIIKTDGNLLFQVNRNRILIIRAVPATSMALLSNLKLGEEGFWPSEIYVADNRLVILGSSTIAASGDTGYIGPVPSAATPGISIGKSAATTISPVAPSIRYMPPQPQVSMTKVLTYDIADPGNPRRTGSYEVEGSLLASRRIDGNLYVVTNKNLYYGMVGSEPGTPLYRSGTGDYLHIAPTTVSWCPDFTEANYLVVSGINLADPAKTPSMYTMLGAGQTVYSTADSLFVAVQRQGDRNIILPMTTVLPAAMKASDGGFRQLSETTDIYRFALQDGAASLVSRGTVPGRLLNQFSMDWHKDDLRVATTTGWASRTGEPTSSNQVCILDGMLNLVGMIPDIAPGEQIYSSRFLGDRGYLVTYRTTDPLYVLDLSVATKPAILGELKIPGYSNYLHPYDETHLIGFGKDAVELESSWDPGTKWAYYQGLKVALFDVSDVTKPTLMHEVHIGARGTDSELLNNHRALLFSKSRNLVAFPVTLMETAKPGSSATDPEASIEYGTLNWQGLMAYRLTLEKGFEKLAAISHLDPGDLWNQDRYVSRGAYIGDVLYTFSNREIRATDMTTWVDIGKLLLP